MSTTRTALRWLAPLAAAAIAVAASAPAAAAGRGILRGGTGGLGGFRAAATGSCTPAQLSLAQTKIGQELTGRETRLQRLQREVARAALLTASDRATLSTDLSGELSGIESLVPQVASATTCDELVADARAMVTQYRVYVVMTPQVHQVMAADSETAVAGQLQSYEPRITAAIDRAEEAGADVVGPQEALADLESQVMHTQSEVAGITASVLALTPASYPGCWSTFQVDLTQLESGVDALRQAGRDLRTIVTDLRGTTSPASAAATT